MKWFIFVLILLVSQMATAGRFEVQIDSIDEGKSSEPHLILMSDGQVGFLDPKESDLLDELREVVKKNETIEIVLSTKHKVLSFRSIAPKTFVEPLQKEDEGKLQSYEPTIVSLDTAYSIFSQMRRNYQNESQCYNRAHIWTYEEFQRSGVKSMKLFMFFTRRYIRNYNFYWWFHVTPMFRTASGDRTLDRRYARSPLQIKTWTDIFISSRRTCPVVARYSDYRNNQESQDCYLIPVSMYFWQPRDIERRDRTGYEKTSFIKSEVNHAYWEAF